MIQSTTLVLEFLHLLTPLCFQFVLMPIRRWSSCAHHRQATRWSGWRRPNSPLETVSRCQDPLVVDQGASAGVASHLVQTRLPGPSSGSSVRAPHNLGVERCDTAIWTQMTKNLSSAEDQRLKLAASNEEERERQRDRSLNSSFSSYILKDNYQRKLKPFRFGDSIDNKRDLLTQKFSFLVPQSHFYCGLSVYQ